MPANFNSPTLSTAYTTYLSTLKERDVDALTLCVSDPTNIPAGAMKWNRAGLKFQEYVSSAWEDKVLSIAGGGTGASNASAARTALGLGTLAIQDNNNVNITGGTIGTTVNIDSTRLTSGTIAPARLGSGGGGAGQKYLADDSTWKDINSFPIGGMCMWGTVSAPSGFLLCDGTAVSRATYSALFAVIGTTFGAGDGSSTFNIPNFQQRFPLGKAASGSGSTIGNTGGAIDHTHSGPTHTHTYTQVPNHTHPVNISDPGHDHTQHGIPGGSADAAAGFSFTVVRPSNYVNVGTAFTGITATTSNPSGGVGTGTTDAAGAGNTSAENPPFLAVTFIIKY